MIQSISTIRKNGMEAEEVKDIFCGKNAAEIKDEKIVTPSPFRRIDQLLLDKLCSRTFDNSPRVGWLLCIRSWIFANFYLMDRWYFGNLKIKLATLLFISALSFSNDLYIYLKLFKIGRKWAQVPFQEFQTEICYAYVNILRDRRFFFLFWKRSPKNQVGYSIFLHFIFSFRSNL